MDVWGLLKGLCTSCLRLLCDYFVVPFIHLGLCHKVACLYFYKASDVLNKTSENAGEPNCQ